MSYFEEVIDEWLYNCFYMDDFYDLIKGKLTSYKQPLYRVDRFTEPLEEGNHISPSLISFTKNFKEIRYFLEERIGCYADADYSSIYIFECTNCIGFDVQSFLLNRMEYFPSTLGMYHEAEVILPDDVIVQSIQPLFSSIPTEKLPYLNISPTDAEQIHYSKVIQKTSLQPSTITNIQDYSARKHLVDLITQRSDSFGIGYTASCCKECGEQHNLLENNDTADQILFCNNKDCKQYLKPIFTTNDTITSF